MNPRASRARVSHERWLVSYADFITLMFAFFVVLYATATADQKKQAQVSESINSAFHALGIFPSSARKPADAPGADKPPLPMNSVPSEAAPAEVREDLNHVRSELTQALSSQIASGAVSIQMGRDGLVVSLREAGFFASGSATPEPGTLPVLRKVAAALARTPFDLRIEGHTDNVPIHTSQFGSNWELSSARATGAARLLLEEKLLPSERLSVAGYAEFHPVASNDTASGRAQNRRVDLVVLPRISLDLPATAPSRPDGPWRKITDGE
ncbi:MAG TPA: flagellar motor protein MotB [Terracidiphilus sp.]|nr:flagellar motor protein MotB [Terracidiphilus sp.]